MADALEALRREHRQWRDEHAQWRVNLDIWQRQISRAEAIAYELETALPQGAPLHGLRSDIERHEQALTTHERRLDQSPDEDLTRLHSEHQALRQRHQRLRERYLDFRRRHHEGMAEIRRLIRLLDR